MRRFKQGSFPNALPSSILGHGKTDRQMFTDFVKLIYLNRDLFYYFYLLLVQLQDKVDLTSEVLRNTFHTCIANWCDTRHKRNVEKFARNRAASLTTSLDVFIDTFANQVHTRAYSYIVLDTRTLPNDWVSFSH